MKVIKQINIIFLLVSNGTIVMAKLGKPLSCPVGWEQVGNNKSDIAGCGLEYCDHRYNKKNIEECKNHCEGNEQCKSFTWAPQHGDSYHPYDSVCTIYESDIPNQEWGPYQIMCKQSLANENEKNVIEEISFSFLRRMKGEKSPAVKYLQMNLEMLNDVADVMN